jgi:hypothetical protein
MRKIHKALLAGGVSLAVLLPVSAAFADSNGTGRGGNGGGNGVAPTCTGDQAMDRDQLRDGTGWRHTLADGTVVEMPGAPYGQHTGPMDGTGPQADRPMDGTGNQQRPGG